MILISLFFFITFTPDAIIKQFAQGLPFPLFVSTIGLADGFNPCVFTVLIILLSLLSYTKSRIDMTLIGSTFVATSGVMYFLFIMIMILVGSVFLEKYGTIFMLVLEVIITLAGLLILKITSFLNKHFLFPYLKNSSYLLVEKPGKLLVNYKIPRVVGKCF
ncbi:MAG: hypothetical protein AAGJ08_01320 [Cyanobacteria bacterium P01_H01_bin.35]